MKWSSSEDLLLIEGVKEHGQRWRTIKKSFNWTVSEDAEQRLSLEKINE